jgi:hypothetical protein
MSKFDTSNIDWNKVKNPEVERLSALFEERATSLKTLDRYGKVEVYNDGKRFYRTYTQDGEIRWYCAEDENLEEIQKFFMSRHLK